MDADPLKLKSRAFAFDCSTSTPNTAPEPRAAPWNGRGIIAPSYNRWPITRLRRGISTISCGWTRLPLSPETL